MKKPTLNSIGELQPHPDLPDEWLISGAIPIPFFDGKELKFTLDGYSDDDEAFLIEADAYDKPDEDDELLSKF